VGFIPSQNRKPSASAFCRNKSQIAEITVPYEGGVIRAEESTTDMYASIDNVLEKLDKQLIRYRHKRNGKAQRNSTIRSEFMDQFDESDYKEDEPAIVKVKKFNVKPMTEEEAMMQIEMLGHSFYVYEDADTSSINVLYKRKDGNYGLIETKR